MKNFFAGLVLVFSAICGCYANDAVTLEQVLANTMAHGLVPLDQGYRGRFTKIYRDESGPFSENNAFEFTYASLNDRGIGNQAPPGQAIVVGIKSAGTEQVEGYRYPAYFISTLPAFDSLIKIRSIEEFKNIFGPFRDYTDVWGSFQSPREMHSSIWWMGFTRHRNGSIRVVRVFLTTIDHGHGIDIDKRTIAEGSFLPTGVPPVPELGANSNRDQAAAQKSR